MTGEKLSWLWSCSLLMVDFYSYQKQHNAINGLWFYCLIIMLSLFIWAGCMKNWERIWKSRNIIDVLEWSDHRWIFPFQFHCCWCNVACVINKHICTVELWLWGKNKKDHSFVCRDEITKGEWGARMWTFTTHLPSPQTSKHIQF